MIKKAARSGIKKLFRNARIQESKVYTTDLIADLPLPVKHYFKYALKNNQPYVNFLRLKYDGKIKTKPGNNWMDIRGEQYFSANPPGFYWIGKTKMFTASDSFIEGKGNLSVYLFGLLRIVNKKGKTINQAELLRWLGESVWSPTNLLPNENITWSAINNSSAKLTMTQYGITADYTVHINKKGQITKLETQRYMEDKLEKWVGEINNYQNINGMMLPATINASWLLNREKYTYAEFYVSEFEFNEPRLYK